jgi:hypothetical protein
MPYLEHIDLSRGPINVKLAVGRSIGIDPLAREEVDNVLGSVLVPVTRRDLL